MIAPQLAPPPAAEAPAGHHALAEHGEAFEAVRAHPLFTELTDSDLILSLGRRDFQLRRYLRDDLVADGTLLRDHGPHVLLVLTGQIGLAAFPRDVLREEHQWLDSTPFEIRDKKIRPQGPLMRLAERNITTFDPGDVFNSRAVAADPDRAAVFALAPSELLAMSPGAIGALTARHPALATGLGRAVAASHHRLSGLTGLAREVADFHVRHGLSIAGTLRVLQVDRCIDCRQCERACADRYGVKRLSIHGPRLGLVDFVSTCRTCSDQRCISPCNFDSIEFDPVRREVVIREDSCTGCASCATACPYGAIKMVSLADRANKRFTARLARSGALAHGGQAPRREPAEQIASKCDHCASHADQACISHCPTGALIEISPLELFRNRAMSSQPFEHGLDLDRSPSGKVKPRRVGAWVWWMLFGLGLLGAALEIVARNLAPELSIQYRLLLDSGLEPAIARFNVGYLAGSELSLALGYTGTGLMLVALLYPVRKRWRPLHRLASGRAWFDLHLVGGVLGPFYILLHSGFHVYNWVAVALWSIAAVVVSGIIGRYLYTRNPERFDGVNLIASHHEHELAAIGADQPEALAVLRDAIASYRAWAQPRRDTSSFLRAVVWLIADDVRRTGAGGRLRRRLARTRAPRRQRAQMLDHARRVIAVDRRRGIAVRFDGFFRTWLRIHVMFTFVAAVVSVAHIITALTFSM